MIIKIDVFEFVLTKVDDGDRRVIVVRDTTSNSEVCVDATKEQVATLADALGALSR